MAQGARTYTVELDLTTGGEPGTTLVDYSSSIELGDIQDAAQQLDHTHSDIKRTYALQGLFQGTVPMTLSPATPGATLATNWDAAVNGCLLVTVVITSNAKGSESVPASTDNPMWRYTGYVFDYINKPMPHGQKKSHNVTLSIKRSWYAITGGGTPTWVDADA